MSDTISRYECPTCGKAWDQDRPAHWSATLDVLREASTVAVKCPGVPVLREYVAVDALPTPIPPTRRPPARGTHWNDCCAAIEAAKAGPVHAG